MMVSAKVDDEELEGFLDDPDGASETLDALADAGEIVAESAD